MKYYYLGTTLNAREKIFHESISSVAHEERRRFQRLRIQVPIFVRGRDFQGEPFLELSKTLDISAVGAFITCPRVLQIEGLITLTIPAPSITSSALVPAGMPPIQARVRRQQEAGDVHLIALDFLQSIG